MAKSSWLLRLVAVLLMCPASLLPAAEILAENSQPKVPLTPDMKAEAEKLLKAIEAEKQKVKKFVDPVEDIKAKLKAPVAKLAAIGESMGKVTKLLDDIKEKKKLEKEDESVLSGEGKNVSPAYAKAAMEVAKQICAAKPDPKKLEKAEEVFSKAGSAATDKLEKEVGKLENKKNELEVILRKESAELNAARAKLAALYGYEVEGAGATLFASENSGGGEGEAMKWIDSEIRFIELLSKLGYDDMATAYLTKVEKMPDPYTKKGLSTGLRNYLSKASAKLLQSKALGSKEIKDKLLQMQDSLKMYTNVRQRLTPQTSMHYDASNDLINAYFRFAENLHSAADAQAQLIGSKFKPVSLESMEKAKGNKKKKDPKAAANQELTAEGLDKLDPVALNDLALNKSIEYYFTGMELATPMSNKVQNTFSEMIENYQTALEENNKNEEKRYLKLLEKFSPYKLRLQHCMEGAYADWPMLYPAGSKDREAVARDGGEFIENNIDDYNAIWPDDKQVYAYWMQTLSVLPDPLFEKGEDGKELPRFIELTAEEKKALAKDEIQEELDKLERYPWTSGKIDHIFKRHIVGSKKMLGKTDKRATVQASRVRGLFCYAQAKVNLARSHYDLADREKDGNKRGELLKHAELLHSEAAQVLEDVRQEKSQYVGDVDVQTRYNSQFKIAIPYYLYLANRAVRLKDTDKATEYAQTVMDMAALLIGVNDPIAKSKGGDALAMVQGFSKKNSLSVGGTEPDDMSLPLIVSNAEKLFSGAINDERNRKNDDALAKLRQSRDFYIIGIDKARRLTDKVARDKFFPKALYTLAAISIKLKDYGTAYVASQLLVQEFRNDFKEPSLNYSPDQYPGTKTYFPYALNNLRAAAALRVRERGNDIERRDYVDALLLCIRYSAKNEDYLTLINTFKAMKQFSSAVKFIDSVAPENDYYRLAQLMGAGIYLDLAKQDTAELKGIQDQLNPPLNEDGKPTATVNLTEAEKKELVKRKGELEAELVLARRKAGEYANKFITLHKEAAKTWDKNPAPSEYIQGIRKQEKGEVLKARFIPIMVAHASRQWDEVQKAVPVFLKQLAQEPNATAEEKHKFEENSLWMVFEAILRSVDFDTVSLEEGARKMAELEKAANNLAKVDTTNQFDSKIATIMGNRWNRLANRAEKKGDKSMADKYSLASVNWLEKAEGRIYENLSGAVSMIVTLAEQKLWERAIAVGDKVISYWGDSLFTDTSLVQNGKKLGDIKGIAATMKNALGDVFPEKEILAAAKGGKDELVKKLNSYITKTDCAAKAKEYGKAIRIGLALNDNKMKKTLELADDALAAFLPQDKVDAAIMKLRPHLLKMGISGELRNFLNRTMLEAAYSDVLYHRPLAPVVPSPVMFYKHFKVPGYSSSAGRKKAAIFMAMIEPNFSVMDVREVFGEGYPKTRDGGLLKEWKEKVATLQDGEEKTKLQRLIMAVETPLVVSLYGEPDKRGRLTKRNYSKARLTVRTILDYEKEHPSDDFDGKFPLKDALENLDKALVAQNTVLYAQKNYAKSMVEHGDYEKAQKYLTELCAMFPGDWSLSLELARVYIARAKYINKDGKLELRPYSYDGKDPNNPATLFLQGIAQSLAVNTYTTVGSEAWWKSRMMMTQAQVDSMEARKKVGKSMMGIIKAVPVSFNNPATNAVVTKKFDIKPMDEYEEEVNGVMTKRDGLGRATAINIQRDLASLDPVPPDEVKEELQGYAKRMETLGYKVTLENALANGAADDGTGEAAAEKSAASAKNVNAGKKAPAGKTKTKAKGK